MKRYILIALCLCGFMLSEAQTFNYTGIELKNEKVKKKNVYEWEQFILFHYGAGFGKPYLNSFGVTYGQVKLFGWYASMMLGTGMHYGYQYEANYQNMIDDVYPFYTDKISNNRISFSAGAIVRMVAPIYLYAGVGYAYRTVTRQIAGGDWVRMPRGGYNDYQSIGNAFLWEVGVQGNIKGFTLSAAYCMMVGSEPQHELKIGIGYTFKTKKSE
ncbi:MAG: hypothetical protein IJ834_03840 [Paludibacteraceae bacterium]|nr:hypothetical protein [Paludibacteraceae bacterium]